jgi:PPK2 family polyphosphate:nucleotide phosphotransferase
MAKFLRGRDADSDRGYGMSAEAQQHIFYQMIDKLRKGPERIALSEVARLAREAGLSPGEAVQKVQEYLWRGTRYRSDASGIATIFICALCKPNRNNSVLEAKDQLFKKLIYVTPSERIAMLLDIHPSAMELQHDFLWRTTRDLPERGRIGIFNRSYYEEVLIVRVHPEILRGEGIGDGALDENTLWQSRFRSIVGLEKHLHRNGTRIVKFYLHLSKNEQRKRFLQRIDEPHKDWKFSLADVEERKFWKRYMSAYEECLSATSTHEAPWYVVPADDKENARLIVSQIILDTLNGLEMSYPEVSPERRQELQSIRERLTDGDLD